MAEFGGVFCCHFLLLALIIERDFSNNTAEEGGAIEFLHFYIISVKGSSKVTFRNNIASSGGAIHSFNGSIQFEEISKTVFDCNAAVYGEAIFNIANNII